MKKSKNLTNSGFTLVELIVCFALITIVSLGFFKTILSLQEQQLLNIAKNNFKAFSTVLNNKIQHDFINDKIEKIEACGDMCYDITYTARGTIRLSYDEENSVIYYDDIKEKIPKNYKFLDKIEINSYSGEEEGFNSFFSINMYLKNNYDSKIENIKYLYQYDKNKDNIEFILE